MRHVLDEPKWWQVVLVVLLVIVVIAVVLMALHGWALLVLFSLNTLFGTQYPYDVFHSFAVMMLLFMLAVFRWYKPE